MDLKHAKILLEKINSLYKSISMDDGKIASIEKDLMLSYIRQLYDAFQDFESDSTKAKVAAKKPRTSVETEFEVVAPEPPKRKYKPPKIIEIPDSIKELEKEESSRRATPPPVEVQAQKPKPTPQPKPEPKPAAPMASGPIDDEIEALFEHKEAKELSEKLSQRPVSDLTKSLAINDRLLYMNALFGKDQNALNAALKDLNGLSNMNQAKGLLVQYAQQHDWGDKEKSKVAKSFISLVRRRYK